MNLILLLYFSFLVQEFYKFLQIRINNLYSKLGISLHNILFSLNNHFLFFLLLFFLLHFFLKNFLLSFILYLFNFFYYFRIHPTLNWFFGFRFRWGLIFNKLIYIIYSIYYLTITDFGTCQTIFVQNVLKGSTKFDLEYHFLKCQLILLNHLDFFLTFKLKFQLLIGPQIKHAIPVLLVFNFVDQFYFKFLPL